jgi:anti-sigma B factor antagonist
MTAVFPPLPSDGPERAVAVLPSELLTVTAQPAPSGVVAVAAHGEVDSWTGSVLQDALLVQLRSAGPELVIDLSDMGFFGAAGLTVLVTVREAAVTAGVRLCLVAHTRVVLLPLTITGLDRVFDIYPSLADTPPFRGDGPNA